MYLNLTENTIGAFVCVGPTHEEPVLIGFSAQKGKAALSDADVRTALTSVAIKHGWIIGAKAQDGKTPDLCERCGVELSKRALARAQEAFEAPENAEDEAKLQGIADDIEGLESYLGKFDPDRKKGQQELPLAEADPKEAFGDGDDERETPEDDEEQDSSEPDGDIEPDDEPATVI